MTAPMQLVWKPGDAWRATVGEKKIGLGVAGTEHGPDPELEKTLRDLVERWPEVRATIAEFAAALPADASIPLQAPLSGSFAAGNCGFDRELYLLAIEVTNRSAPSRAIVTFYTGFPDGYATFEIALECGRPVAIEAFAS